MAQTETEFQHADSDLRAFLIGFAVDLRRLLESSGLPWRFLTQKDWGDVGSAWDIQILLPAMQNRLTVRFSCLEGERPVFSVRADYHNKNLLLDDDPELRALLASIQPRRMLILPFKSSYDACDPRADHEKLIQQMLDYIKTLTPEKMVFPNTPESR